MNWRRAAAVVLGVALLPGLGTALEVDGELRFSTDYDSNVARVNARGRTDDFIFRVTPTVKLLEDDGKFQFVVNYRFPYEVAVKTRRLDGFRHFLDAEAEYSFSERTRLFFRDSFSKSDSITNARNIASADFGTVGTGRIPVFRNRGTLGLSHSFTQRTNGSVAFTHRFFDSDLPTRAQTNVFVGNAQMSYGLTPLHRVGGGATATYQTFAETDLGRPARQAFFLNLFASWNWTIDETTTLFVRGGPTYIQNQQTRRFASNLTSIPFPVGPAGGGGVVVFDATRCGAAPGVGALLEACGAEASTLVTDANVIAALTDPSGATVPFVNTPQTFSFDPALSPVANASAKWDFFAEVSFLKRWRPNHVSTLQYRRTDSTSSGLGSSVLDGVSLIHNWEISELWRVALRADFTRRASSFGSSREFTRIANMNVQGQPVAAIVDLVALRSSQSAINTTRYGVRMDLTRRITRHLRTGLRYSFNRQSSGVRSLGRLSDFNNHIVTLGIQYDFDQYSLDRRLPW